jgi:hypothetical protein
MLSSSAIRTCIGLGATLWILTAAAPAYALDPGCTCPAGIPVGSSSCFVSPYTVAAVCTGPKGAALNQSIGHLATTSQQLSFEGVRLMLEGRRDQLQGTLGGTFGNLHPHPMGYAPSALEQEQDFEPLAPLSYAGSKQSNPLAAMAYKAPQAPASTGPSFATWVQGLGDIEHDQASSADDTGHTATTYAAQGGIDGTWQNVSKSGDALVLGLVGSYTNAYVGYDGTPTATKLKGPGVGLYGTYLSGGFSADLTGKFDFLGLDEDFAGIVPSNSLDLVNAGASGNLQYKVALAGGGFVEPTGGFSFTRTMFGSGAAALGLTDASTLRLQAGSRWGTSFMSGSTSVEPSLKAVAYDNVIADGSANSAVAGIVATDEGKIRGEVTPSLDLDFGNGASATLSSSVRFGQGMLGGSASVNLRRQW